MPVIHSLLSFLSGLRDRAPARGERDLYPLLRPARPGLRLGRAARDGDARADRRRAAVDLALRRPAARLRARRAAARARLDAARAGAAARRGARHRRAVAQARHREPDALVQGPRRRGRRAQGAGARADDALVLVDREPRRRRRRASGRRGARGRRLLPADLEPEKLAAAAVYGPTIYAVDGTYDHCSRLSVELSFELDGASSTSTCARTTPRARRRSPTRSPSSSAGRPRRDRDPDRLGRPLPQGRPGLRELRALGLVDGETPALVGGQAEGCEPVATAFRDGARVTPVRPDTIARSLAIGNPADGDFAVATARETGGSIHTVAEDEIGENMALLASTTGVFGETATGVTLGALRAAIADGFAELVRARRPARHRRRAEDAAGGRAHVRSRAHRGGRGRVRRQRGAFPWTPPRSVLPSHGGPGE